MLDRLLALQERGRPLINSGRAAASEIMQNDSLKKENDALYQHYFGRVVTGCKNCYADALIELCTLKKATAMSRTEKFVVRRGKVLKDKYDARLNLVHGNETDDLCLHHLYTNPSSIEFFDKRPSDDELDEMLAEYAEKFEASRNAKHGNGSGNAEADKIVNDAKDKAAAIEIEAQKFIDEANIRVTEITDEAKAEAKKITDDAKTEADKIVNDAKTEAARLIDDAKAEADKIVKTAKTEAKASAKKTSAKADDPMLE